MAIKISGVDVIDDNRRGIFAKLNPGVYTTTQREALSGLGEGEIVYDSTEQKLFLYTGSAWAGVGGGGGNGLVSSIPPFAAHAQTDTFLKSDDGKVEFSLDNSTFTTTLEVPRNTQYFVGWGTDIRYAVNGSSYSASIGATFTQIGASGTTTTIEYEISSIDKVPDLSVGFTSSTDVAVQTEFESDIISPFETINAPSQIWVTSDAPSYKLRIGFGTWFDPPSIPSTTYINRNEEIQVKHTTGDGALTTYSTTVNVGYGTDVGEFAFADFDTTTQSISIATPIISGDIGSDVDTQPTFTTSSYTTVGNTGTHTSTDWQIASDSSFTSIVAQSIGDTSALTSWTPYVTSNPASNQTVGRLEGSTTYYIRCRYNSSNGYTSDYGTATLTTETLLESYSTASQTINRPSSNYSKTAFTVPSGVGRIKATLNGNSNGGLLVGNFKVIPGETLQIYNTDGAVSLWQNDTSITNDSKRSELIAIVGNGGGSASRTDTEGETTSDNNAGDGGSNDGEGGGNGENCNGGGGGGQGGPGTGGSGTAAGSAGSGFAGGGGNEIDDGDPTTHDRSNGGDGGAGWYGGGGGGVWRSNRLAGGGGGGSSRMQTPSNASWRNTSVTTNTRGTSNGSLSILLEW